MSETTNVDKIIDLVLLDAEERAQNAGFAGSMDDGGASRLKEQVRFYQMGREGKLPTEWEKYEVQLDPEYQIWLELDKKFSKFRK